MSKQRITILSPTDLKVGTVAPDGREVALVTAYWPEDESVVVVLLSVTFTDGSEAVYSWPNGAGWTVDGRTA